MAEIIGVRFKNVGKIYYFDPDGKQINNGQQVIVETARGVECAQLQASSIYSDNFGLMNDSTDYVTDCVCAF